MKKQFPFITKEDWAIYHDAHMNSKLNNNIRGIIFDYEESQENEGNLLYSRIIFKSAPNVYRCHWKEKGCTKQCPDDMKCFYPLEKNDLSTCR